MKVITLAVLTATCVWGLPHNLKRESKLDGRIVGGWDALIEDFPYQVSILYHGYHECGGFIISQNWVVTAGHCAYEDDDVSWLSVRAGSSIVNSGGVVLSLAAFIFHPSYIDYLQGYDIALFQLSSSLPLGISISTVALPAQGEVAPKGSLAVATGWGAIAEDGPSVEQLQAVEVPFITNEECAAIYGPLISDSMICAGFVDVGGRDACQGDSGGPLVWNGIVFGVVSWGDGCARPNAPGVYARVAFVRDWIREVSGV